MAVRADDLVLVNCLLKGGADPSLPDGEKGMNAVQLAKKLRHYKIEEKLEAALAR